MDDDAYLASRFEENRGRLTAVAYRMLGSTAEADDAVQDAWLRLSRSDAREIDNLGAWLTTVVAVVLAVVVMSMSRFSVVVDRRGLVVRGVLGVPRVVVPLDEVVRAGAVQISPFADFGGWGYRVGRAGRIGVVVRTGEAIEVERTGGRSFVVTVDDAATAAALLNTLAARSRPA